MNKHLYLAPLFNGSLSRRALIDAFKIALLVGISLNLINNGTAYYYDKDISGYNVFLNFAIPFLVSTYSGTRATYTSGGQH